MIAPVQPGDLLAGKYEVLRVLGVGGMGVVVAARHRDLDERVALKFLLPDVLGLPEVVERFAREARAAVKIKSEHVARVTDVGKLDDGSPYMVMEYLEGEDLSSLMSKRGALPVEEAAEYVLQACEAIAEAHVAGIVHRDLKPANLFLTTRPDGTPSIKVLDFGISKLPSSGSGPDAQLTKTSTVVGSPQYMSPEQMRSIKKVDARGDIWALGVILHELVSGKAAFEGETMPELVLKIMGDDAAPLTKARPGTPRGLEALVQRCLQKAPEKRFQSIGDLAAALVEFAPKRASLSLDRIRGVLDQARKSAAMIGPVDGNTAAPVATLASWGAGSSSTRAGGRAPLIALAAGVVVIGVATFFALRGRGGGEVASGKGSPSAAVGATPEVPQGAAQANPGPSAVPVVPASAAQPVVVTPAPPPKTADPAAAPSTSAPISPKGSGVAALPRPTAAPQGEKAPPPKTAEPAPPPPDWSTQR